MRYWLKVPPASDSFLAATPGKPLVFLHGVGLGLVSFPSLLMAGMLHVSSLLLILHGCFPIHSRQIVS